MSHRKDESGRSGGGNGNDRRAKDGRARRFWAAAGVLLGAAAVVAGSPLWPGESMPSFIYRTVYLPAAHPKARPQHSVRNSGPSLELAVDEHALTVTPFLLGGRRAGLAVEPRGRAARRTILYLHGGAYVAQMIPAESRLVGALAHDADARVVVLDYPLAPEHGWRETYAALDQAWATIARVSRGDVSICGFSAGGGLALGFAQRLRDRGGPQPRRIALVSPWLDLRAVNPAQAALEARDPILIRSNLVESARLWARGAPLDAPPISPAFGSLNGLPPIILFSGTADLLNADARALAARAEAEGVPIHYVEGRNMLHSWALMRFPFVEGARLRTELTRFLIGGPAQ